MGKSRVIVMSLLACFFLLFFCGCSGNATPGNNINPTFSSSEFLSNESKVPVSVMLCITDEFGQYSATHHDPADMQTWCLHLGPLATDAYTYAFQNRFSNVIVKKGEPNFPLNDNVDFVVKPVFTYFKSGEPVIVKFENYWVDLALEPILKTPELPIYSKATVPLKGFRDEKAKNKEQIQDFR